MNLSQALLLLILAVFWSPSFGDELEVEKPEIEKLGIGFAGLYLGCTEDELSKVMKAGPNSVSLFKKVEHLGTTIYYYDNNPRFKDAAVTLCGVRNGKLVSVGISFEDDELHSRFNALRLLAERKYGKMRDKVRVGGVECNCLIAGMDVVLTFSRNPGGTPITTVGAFHRKMIAVLEHKIGEDAKDLGEF